MSDVDRYFFPEELEELMDRVIFSVKVIFTLDGSGNVVDQRDFVLPEYTEMCTGLDGLNVAVNHAVFMAKAHNLAVEFEIDVHGDDPTSVRDRKDREYPRGVDHYYPDGIDNGCDCKDVEINSLPACNSKPYTDDTA